MKRNQETHEKQQSIVLRSVDVSRIPYHHNLSHSNNVQVHL